MEFPKGFIQERDKYRPHENERKLHAFLKEFFTKIYYKVVSSVGYYLINKSTITHTDKVQVGENLQISNHGTNAALTLMRTEGTEEAPTATSNSIIGSVRAFGYNGTGYSTAATIWFHAAENFTSTTSGGYISFNTTPIGTLAFQPSGFIAPSGSWASGTGSLATTATSGFLYIPTCAGVPTGVPESISGRIPLVADVSGGKIYAYLGGWTALN